VHRLQRRTNYQRCHICWPATVPGVVLSLFAWLPLLVVALAGAVNALITAVT
jgi:hypothetical protein